MLTPGLVSVTFRPLSKEEICERMETCGLTVIEWGGDVHVPSDSPQDMADACSLSAAHGIRTVAYGSYWRAGALSEASHEKFRQELGCARALGAKTIRVWAGTKGSGDCSADERQAVVATLQDACRGAANSGLTVSLECHGGTLTDDCDSALRLVDEVAMDALRLYWQPNQYRDHRYNVDTLRCTLPYVSNVHVFSWEGAAHYPLVTHTDRWREYIEILSGSGRDHNLLLEFMHNDSPAQLPIDSAVLRNWVEGK